MDKALITIVIPVRNRAKLVVSTLASIDAQTTRDFCVILVDNASTDGTGQVLRKWAEKTNISVTLLEETVPGAAAARNRGLKSVTTPWVMFFDSDDTMPEGNLKDLINAINSHPEAEIIGIERRFYTPEGTLLRKDSPYRKDAVFHCLFHGGMATAAFIARTSLVRKAGTWNENISTWDDIEMGLRILMRSPSIAIAHGSRCDIMVHESSISGTNFSSRSAQIERAMEAMEGTLRDNGRSAQPVDVLRGIIAGRYAVEGSPALAARLSSTLRTRTGRLAYAMSRSGMRGVARLLRPFINV